MVAEALAARRDCRGDSIRTSTRKDRRRARVQHAQSPMASCRVPTQRRVRFMVRHVRFMVRHVRFMVRHVRFITVRHRPNVDFFSPCGRKFNTKIWRHDVERHEAYGEAYHPDAFHAKEATENTKESRRHDGGEPTGERSWLQRFHQGA
jgi:hypothetical protein